jgi:hypothetical protein
MNWMQQMPPCPPSGPDWDEMLACWREIRDFKRLIDGVIKELYGDTPPASTTLLDIINAAIENHPPTQTVIENIVNNYVTNNVVPTMGITDGSAATPGQVGEFYQSLTMVPYTTGTQTQQVSSGMLPAGDWDCEATFVPYGNIQIISFHLNPQPAGFSQIMTGIITQVDPGQAVAMSSLCRALTTENTTLNFQLLTTTSAAANQGSLIFVARRMR